MITYSILCRLLNTFKKKEFQINLIPTWKSFEIKFNLTLHLVHIKNIQASKFNKSIIS